MNFRVIKNAYACDSYSEYIFLSKSTNSMVQISAKNFDEVKSFKTTGEPSCALVSLDN